MMIKTFSILLPFKFLSLQMQAVMSEQRIFDNVDMHDMCYKEKIIPDVIQYPPVHLLQVHWKNVSANLGNALLPDQLSEKPVCQWPHKDEAHYTLVFIAPDMPDPKNCTQREYQCWVVVNIPGTQVDKGQVLTAYIPPPTPPADGCQRYVMLLYMQPRVNITFLYHPYIPPVPNEVVRQKFSATKFSENYAFGTPLAINWFRINWNSSNRS